MANVSKKSPLENTGPQARAKALVAEMQRAEDLRSSPGATIFAIDSTVVQAFISPLEQHWRFLLPLLYDSQTGEHDFTPAMQGASLARRVARHILLGAGRPANHAPYRLLHGHSYEFFKVGDRALDSATKDIARARKLAEGTDVSPWYADLLAPSTGSLSTARNRLEAAIDRVPEHIYGALGLNDSNVAWQLYAEVLRARVIGLASREEIWPDSTSEHPACLDARVLAENADKFFARMPPVPSRIREVFRRDAQALAHLQGLNKALAADDPPRRCILITNSEHLFELLKSYPAGDFGANSGDDNGPASQYCLIRPEAFLDECHLHLTGEQPTPSRLYSNDRGGRLSRALRVFSDAASHPQGPDEASHLDFPPVWGDFLRASVIEQVETDGAIRTNLRRQVVWVLRKAGISAIAGGNAEYVRALSERGSKMMFEAADCVISSGKTETFSRGAPVLRLDAHPVAERLQWLVPSEFRSRLLDTNTRENLINEAQSLYTVHLMQVRALIWENRWRAASILAEYTVALAKSMYEHNIELGKVDGREACFLAAVCIRMQVAKDSGWSRANSLLDQALALSANDTSIDSTDKHLHSLRVAAEKLAIRTMELLQQTASTYSTNLVEKPLVSGMLDATRSLATDLSNCGKAAMQLSHHVQGLADPKNGTVPETTQGRLVCAYLVAQQCFVNLAQTVLLSHSVLERYVVPPAEIHDSLAAAGFALREHCPYYLTGESQFVRTIALLAKVAAGGRPSADDSAFLTDLRRAGCVPSGEAEYSKWRFDKIFEIVDAHGALPRG